MQDFEIQNMVANHDVKFPVKLEELYNSSHKQYCRYDPELFAGLIYNMYIENPNQTTQKNRKIVLLIFVSGKIVFTGAKRIEDISSAWNRIYTVLTQYKKSSS